jgi:predicted SprT family Zn-dependent metalloprotease
MPTLEQIAPGKYRYACTCGEIITMETDAKPKKIYKCWKCQLTEEEMNHGPNNKMPRVRT